MKIFLLLLFTIYTALFAKSDYSIIVHKPFNAALFDITQDYDRTLTAVGFSKEYKKSSSTPQSFTNAFDYLASQSSRFGSQMHIIKVDKNADILFSKVAKLSRFNRAIAVVKTPANGYIIGGFTLDGSLIVAKLNANANVVFTKIFGTKNYDRMSNLILLSDGGVLAIGSSTTSRDQSDDMFNSGLGNTDIFLTRFTKNGKMLWSKKYGTGYDDNAIDAVEAADGSIIVVSTTSYNRNRDVSMMRITENGNRIWLKHYQKVGNNDNTILPKKIIRLKDNNFVLLLTQYNHMQKEHIRIIKFDLYQNILIDKEIFTTYPSELNDIKEYSDGKFIAVGYTKDSYDTDGLAMILDANLVMLLQDHYGKENYDLFHAVTIMHNSQAALAGVHTDANSQERNMWIMKLNQDLSVTQIATDADSFYRKLCKLFAAEIEAHTLQIKRDLTIEFIQRDLYFEAGVYKLTKAQELFLKKFSTKLIPFLYANREIIETFEVNGHTSSEWGNVNFETKYLNNEKLSLNRSYAVIYNIFHNEPQQRQKWLAKVLRGSGYSSSKKVVYTQFEDKKRSRRVSFKIILK